MNGRPGYRCRHGHTSARNRPPELAKNVYIREDHLLNELRMRFAETVSDVGVAIADYLRSNGLTIMCGGPTREVKACGPPCAHATVDETFGDQLLLVALLDGVSYPGQLAEQLGLSRSNMSNHLACLRGCGLVVAAYEGRQVRYALADAHLARALRELVQVVLAVDTDEPCLDEPAVATTRTLR